MQFTVGEETQLESYPLIYKQSEYSFDVKTKHSEGYTSLLVNDLSLEIDERGRLLYVWGYCPLINFSDINVTPDNFTVCNLFVNLGEDPIPGISYRINKDRRWPIYKNAETNWLCIGDPDFSHKQIIKFATDSIAVLQDQQLCALWLHPKII